MILTFEFNLRPTPHQSVKFGRNGIKYKPKIKIIYEIIINIYVIFII